MGDSRADLASNALLSAVQWLQTVLLGTLATTLAILAVASVGYLALSGRIDLRKGATVIAGCFVIFGAPSIARGFQAAAGTADIGAVASAPQAAFSAPLPSPIKTPAAQPYDPYAGASVPQR